jgi:hypothetical protein
MLLTEEAATLTVCKMAAVFAALSARASGVFRAARFCSLLARFCAFLCSRACFFVRGGGGVSFRAGAGGFAPVRITRAGPCCNCGRGRGVPGAGLTGAFGLVFRPDNTRAAAPAANNRAIISRPSFVLRRRRRIRRRRLPIQKRGAVPWVLVYFVPACLLRRRKRRKPWRQRPVLVPPWLLWPGSPVFVPPGPSGLGMRRAALQPVLWWIPRLLPGAIVGKPYLLHARR